MAVRLAPVRKGPPTLSVIEIEEAKQKEKN